MQFDMTAGIDPGNLSLRILTTNETSMTLQADERFAGKIVQPGSAAAGFLGEHGLAAYIEVKQGGVKHAFLFDTGGMNASVLHNLNPMNIKLPEVESVVISHGHLDHTGALPKIIPQLKSECQLIIHPIAYIQNHIVETRTGEEVPLEDFQKAIREMKKAGKVRHEAKLPQLNKALVDKLAIERGVKVVETTTPIQLCPGVATSGEIESANPQEITPGFYLLKGKMEVEKHTFRDEIALYFHVKGKGLVVLTGCGHAGIINTIKHGQKLTGIDKVYAVIGGFHFEMSPASFIDQEIQVLKTFQPEIISGMHCSGLPFNAKLIGQSPHVQGVVGTEFRL